MAREIGQTQAAPRGAHAEPAAGERRWVTEIDKAFAVDEVADADAVGFDADVAPAVSDSEVHPVGVFLEDSGHGEGDLFASLLPSKEVAALVGFALIAAEACGRVVVAAIAHIVELQCVAVAEDALPLPESAEHRAVAHGRVCSHPEAVEVAHAVGGLAFVHQAGIVFDDGASLHPLVAPEGQSLGSHHLERVTQETDLCVGRFAFEGPMGSERRLVEAGRKGLPFGRKAAGE